MGIRTMSEREEFEKVVQEQMYTALNTITNQQFFKELHLNTQTNFITDIFEAIENNLQIALDPVCDDFDEIYRQWTNQDPLSQELKRLSERIKNS